MRRACGGGGGAAGGAGRGGGASVGAIWNNNNKTTTSLIRCFLFRHYMFFVSNQAFCLTFRADEGSPGRNRRRSARYYSATTAGEGVSRYDIIAKKKKCLQPPVDGSSGQSMSTSTAEGSASVNAGFTCGSSALFLPSSF